MSLIDKCDRFADIGCDHGYVCEYVLKNNLANQVIANDVSLPSLQKAKDLLSGYQNIEFLCGDGITLAQKSLDFVTICGMGGKEIIKILDKISPNKGIVQPQKNVFQLREYLAKNSFEIIDDLIAYENSKFYDVIKFKKTDTKIVYDDYQLYFGVNYKNKNELLKKRLLLEDKKIRGYKKNSVDLEKKLNLIKEVIKWQQ